jgi:hypothetical protein
MHAINVGHAMNAGHHAVNTGVTAPVAHEAGRGGRPLPR